VSFLSFYLFQVVAPTVIAVVDTPAIFYPSIQQTRSLTSGARVTYKMENVRGHVTLRSQTNNADIYDVEYNAVSFSEEMYNV
jgi:hypothetical protein